MSKLTVRVNDVKKDFPEIEKALESIEKELRKKTLSEERKVELKEAKGRELAKWFPTWLSKTWSVSKDKVSEAKRADDRYVGKQYRSNKCYSNVIGVHVTLTVV
jgi:hypothetical protein